MPKLLEARALILGNALVATDAKSVKVHTTRCSMLTGATKGN